MIGFKSLCLPQLHHSYPDLRVLKSFIYSGVVFAYNLGTPFFIHSTISRLLIWRRHSSTLSWKILWTEEPSRLQSMGSIRVGHDWATSLSLSLSCIGEGNGNPLQCSCLENPRVRGAWQAAVYGVAQNRTPLKWLSSPSGRLLIIPNVM